VKISVGIGIGNNFPTRDLQNMSKNIFFGGELNEIHLISMYLTHFSTIFHVSGLILAGKAVQVMGKGPHMVGYG